MIHLNELSSFYAQVSVKNHIKILQGTLYINSVLLRYDLFVRSNDQVFFHR